MNMPSSSSSEGKAYVDDLTREQMQEYRGNDAGKPSRPSPYRDRTPEENLDLFRRMRAGEFADGEKTLRAKIDLASPQHEHARPDHLPHQACDPSPPGRQVVHLPDVRLRPPHPGRHRGHHPFSLCSLEFENHRPLYDWVIRTLFGTAFPKQREFARLNVTNTVMSKRYLRELVEKDIVDGWDDPRMPTLCGLRRRGYTPTSIFTFVKERRYLQGRQPGGHAPAGGRAARRAGAERRSAAWPCWTRSSSSSTTIPPTGASMFDLPNNPNREVNDTTTRPGGLYQGSCGSSAATSLRYRRRSSSA